MFNKCVFPVCSLTLLTFTTAAYADFVNDSRLSLDIRNMYLNNHNRNRPAQQSNTQQWGQGLTGEFMSGYTEGFLGFGVDALGTSGINLGGPRGENGSLGLFPNSNSVGQAKTSAGSTRFALKARTDSTSIRAGYQHINLPVIRTNDGRLMPSLYRGVTINSQQPDNLILNAGFIDRVQGRNQTHFQHLKASGSASGWSNGFWFGGGEWKPGKPLAISYYYAQLEDFYKQHYVGLIDQQTLTYGSLITDIRYFRSTSDGHEYGGTVDNSAWGGMLTWKTGAQSFGAGYQYLSGASSFPYLDPGQKVNSTDTGTTGANVGLLSDAPLDKFVYAGEHTAIFKYKLSLQRTGLTGVSLNAAYMNGQHAKAKAGVAGANEWVRTLGIDWDVPEYYLKGLSIAWKNVAYRTNVSSARSQDQNIIEINYRIDFGS